MNYRLEKRIANGSWLFTPAGRPLKPGRLVRMAMVARCGGNLAEAARRLGLNRKNFHNWFRKNGGIVQCPKKRRKG